MARLVTASFETGAALSEGMSALTGLTFATDKAYTQTRSVKLGSAVATGSADYSVSGATGRPYFLRSPVWVASGAVRAFVGLLVLVDASGRGASVNLETDGHLYAKVFSDVSEAAVDLGACPRDQWFTLEMSATFNAAADDTCDVRIEGAAVGSQARFAATTAAPSSLSIGYHEAAPGVDIWFGDFTLGDNQGSNETTWADRRSVYLLVPTADSAVGSGWLKPGGGSTNLWRGEDNLPPICIAHSTSSGDADKQIYNVTSTSTSNYDATMQSYTAAGVNAFATINVVQAIAVTGSNSATDTAGAIQVTSNPAEGAETSFTTFDNGIAGTFPSNWRLVRGAINYAPAPTLGTAPVLRIGKRTATTRATLVGLMGLVVDTRFVGGASSAAAASSATASGAKATSAADVAVATSRAAASGAKASSAAMVASATTSATATGSKGGFGGSSSATAGVAVSSGSKGGQGALVGAAVLAASLAGAKGGAGVSTATGAASGATIGFASGPATPTAPKLPTLALVSGMRTSAPLTAHSASADVGPLATGATFEYAATLTLGSMTRRADVTAVASEADFEARATTVVVDG